MSAVELTPEQALAAILDGKVVRSVTGHHEQDPTCLQWLDDGMIMSESIAGWSAGVVEPVCAADSDFYLSWVAPRVSLTVTDEVPFSRSVHG